MPVEVLVYLVNAAQRRLVGAGDQVSSNADHVDLILLKPPTASVGRRGGLPKSCRRVSHLLVELHHALLADVVGSNDGQRIKGRDGKSEEVTQTDRMKQRRETPASWCPS